MGASGFCTGSGSSLGEFLEGPERRAFHLVNGSWEGAAIPQREPGMGLVSPGSGARHPMGTSPPLRPVFLSHLTPDRAGNCDVLMKPHVGW